KWVVLVAVCRFGFNVQCVSTPPPLDGQVVALDLTIPLTTGQAFTHHFIGIYAPWDPGIPTDDNNIFWPSLTQLCVSTMTSWSLAGDCNATLFSTESTATPYCITTAQLAYNNFLHQTSSIDHWSMIPDHCVQSDFTYSQHSTRGSSGIQFRQTIIDRAASSHIGTAAVTINVLHFLFLALTTDLS
ncbi:hypothetical protein L208DRAFT_1275150, partial [Tricholoma matsutake]